MTVSSPGMTAWAAQPNPRGLQAGQLHIGVDRVDAVAPCRHDAVSDAEALNIPRYDAAMAQERAEVG